MATTDASYSFTLRVKPSASNSYKIGIPFCPASFFDESTINLKIVWGDGSSDTELTTLTSATDNILLEHTYSDTSIKQIEVHGGYGADSNFEGGKIAFPQTSKHDANGIAQYQACPTGSTLDKISQLVFGKVANGKPVTGFYIHGQGDFQNFTKFWGHSTLTQFKNFIWSSDPASEIKHVGDKSFGYICFDKTFENCHTGLAYTSNSNHANYPTAFLQPLSGGGWCMASRRSKSFQRTFANSKVNPGISGWGSSRFARSSREMFKDNTVFSRNINNLFATGNENSLLDMEGMFENTQAFSKHMLNWNTSKVTNMINVFKNSKYDRRLDTWDVAKVTSMKGFLEGNTDYASGDGGDYRDIKEWFDPYLNPDGSKRDASNPRTFAIESLESIFKDSAVNVDISTWNTSTVTNMKNVFNGNTAFDQDISDWDTTNVSTENLAGFATGATGLTASEVPSSVPSDSVAADSSSDDSSSDDSSSDDSSSESSTTATPNFALSFDNGTYSAHKETFTPDSSLGQVNGEDSYSVTVKPYQLLTFSADTYTNSIQDTATGKVQQSTSTSAEFIYSHSTSSSFYHSGDTVVVTVDSSNNVRLHTPYTGSPTIQQIIDAFDNPYDYDDYYSGTKTAVTALVELTDIEHSGTTASSEVQVSTNGSWTDEETFTVAFATQLSSSGMLSNYGGWTLYQNSSGTLTLITNNSYPYIINGAYSTAISGSWGIEDGDQTVNDGYGGTTTTYFDAGGIESNYDSTFTEPTINT